MRGASLNGFRAPSAQIAFISAFLANYLASSTLLRVGNYQARLFSLATVIALIATGCGENSLSIYPASDTFVYSPGPNEWRIMREPGWYSVQMKGVAAGTVTFEKTEQAEYTLKRMTAQGGGPKFVIEYAEFPNEKEAERIRRQMSTNGTRTLRDTAHTDTDAIAETRIDSRREGKRVFILECYAQKGSDECEHFIESFHIANPRYPDD